MKMKTTGMWFAAVALAACGTGFAAPSKARRAECAKRAGLATVFPQSISMAATFDESLMRALLHDVHL